MTTSGRVRGGAWLLTAVAVILLGLTVNGQIRRQRDSAEQARASARAQAATAVKDIEDQLQVVVPVVDALERDLSSGRLQVADITARLSSDLSTHSTLFEIGVAYQPGAANGHSGLFAPHASRAHGTVEPMQLERSYDYTTYEWFRGGLDHAGWGEPYFGAATGSLVVGYNVPFYRSADRKTPIGVVRANFSADGIRSMVSRIGLGDTGFAFLFSRKGVYLSHPDEFNVHRQVTARDLAIAQHQSGRVPLYEKALAGSQTEDLTISDDGRRVWMVQRPIASTGWVFGMEFLEDEVKLNAQSERRGFVRILCAVLLLLFAICLLVIHVEHGGHRELWSATIVLVLILLSGIGATWVLTMRFPDRNGEASVHILDGAALQKFLTVHVAVGRDGVAPVHVPTGVLVRTIRFIDANDAVITGTVWQRVPKPQPPGLNVGIEMPDAEALELADPISAEQGDAVVTSWTFRASLREPSFWSRKYPFDYALLRLRMIPRSSAVPVVLDPDLRAYDWLMPQTMPGVDRSLVLSDWRLDHSYFSYVPQATNVGAAAPANLRQTLPFDLAFNVVVERKFLDPFVSSVLPIIVISCLLFGLLLVGSKNTAKVSATGFKATDVLLAGVTLLFPALVAQVNLRAKIGATGIIYIEYFYFILYVAILGVSANALTFVLAASGVSQVRDNLVSKLLYWPVFLGACFAVTLAFLY